MNEKIRDICLQAQAGKINADLFYDKLSAICDNPDTDGDTACLLEDILMDMEMEHGGSSKSKKKLAAEAAARILEELP